MLAPTVDAPALYIALDKAAKALHTIGRPTYNSSRQSLKHQMIWLYPGSEFEDLLQLCDSPNIIKLCRGEP